MSAPSGENRHIKIYYDGACALCSGLVERIERSSQATQFDPLQIQRALPKGMEFAEADRDIHTVDADGHVLKGADAILHILSHYEQWRWLAWLGSLPIFRHIMRGLYRLVADNRKRLFRNSA